MLEDIKGDTWRRRSTLVLMAGNSEKSYDDDIVKVYEVTQL
jgi:hypothetical protein